MGILRSNTTHHLSSHFHKPSSLSSSPTPSTNTTPTNTPKESQQTPPTSEPNPGINRSATEPVTNNTKAPTSNPLPQSTSSTSSTPPSSRPNSGTSTPHRSKSSMDIVRTIRDRPSSALIPGYHHVAEQLHKYKMRNCHGMSATEEEVQGIASMKKWNWKHAGRPGEVRWPVGPKGEEWVLEGVAREQVYGHDGGEGGGRGAGGDGRLRRHHSG